MNTEETLWWGWSGLAGGSWAAVVCLVVILGSVVNFAVLIHWFTTKPTPESPSAALPFVDLLVCLLAAPLRYASNTPSVKMTSEKDLSPLIANFTADLQRGGALMVPDLEDEVVYEAEKIAFYVTQDNDTEYEEESSTPLSSSDSIHAIVVFICLASLHVVVMVAVHRLALLLRCSPTVLLPFRMTPPVFVLLVALASAGALVGSLHATGQFTEYLPLLGTMKYPVDLSPSSVVVGFLSYTAGLCGIAVFCYGTIIATLLYQGRDRYSTNSTSRQDPLPLTSSTTSSVAMQQSPGEETTVQAYSGHGKAIRACMTVVSVVVTLAVCWAIPISLALYALVTDTQITPALPYSDILLLLSGLIHPFVYGEGWIAVAACYNGVRNMTSATAYRMGLTKRTRTPVRATVRDRRIQEESRRLQHQYVSYCCPCRAASRIPDTQLFSEVATFVNSFPLRHALSRHDPDPL
ncbi:uncharacterized protein [Macrobrachium rosenbergii]|uniref:uncharacterized protein n=1 Tax=Macrobrachium rosenbergii TaxID=79674 RepID=UPI0034D6EEB6